MTKRKTRKTSAKTHRKAPVKTNRARSRKARENANGWEIVPFVLAVIIAIVVIIQSMDAVEKEMDVRQMGKLSFRAHPAAECNADGAMLREIRAKERAVARSISLLEEAQHQFDWDCSTDSHGSLCTHAKTNLEHVHSLVQQELAELKDAREESCL